MEESSLRVIVGAPKKEHEIIEHAHSGVNASKTERLMVAEMASNEGTNSFEGAPFRDGRIWKMET